MQTSPQCLPCFHRQAAYAVDLATSDPERRADILRQAIEFLSHLDMKVPPPVNAIGLYSLIARLSENRDPFATLKRQSNDLALHLLPQVQGMIQQADDPLYQALLFALAGNIIDYGSQQHFDLNHTLRQCLDQRPIIDDYGSLRRELASTETILFLADNCGEIVFDGLLIEQLPGEVSMAVKAGPIINDATLQDAEECGLQQKCRIVSNGTACPGTPLDLCSEEFRELFARADVVISKGQGNFETLSAAGRAVYHLLTVKCPVVGEHAALVSGHPGRIPTGATVLMRLGGKSE